MLKNKIVKRPVKRKRPEQVKPMRHPSSVKKPVKQNPVEKKKIVSKHMIQIGKSKSYRTTDLSDLVEDYQPPRETHVEKTTFQNVRPAIKEVQIGLDTEPRMTERVVLIRNKFELFEKSPQFADLEKKRIYEKFGRDNEVPMDSQKVGRYWVDENRYLDVNVFDPQAVKNAEDLIFYVRKDMGFDKLTPQQKVKWMKSIENVAKSENKRVY